MRVTHIIKSVVADYSLLMMTTEQTIRQHCTNPHTCAKLVADYHSLML